MKKKTFVETNLADSLIENLQSRLQLLRQYRKNNAGFFIDNDPDRYFQELEILKSRIEMLMNCFHEEKF